MKREYSLVFQLKVYLRLFRWKNLVIIALTMILARYALIHPLLGKDITDFPFSRLDFLALVFSTVFIAAGGYIINDYFDVKIDRINRPEKMILGYFVSFRQALTIHQIFSLSGIILGFYAGYKVGSIRLGGIQAIVVAVLWFYAYRYKGLYFWGNFVVSLLSGLVILVVWLFEFYSLSQNALVFGTAITAFPTVNKIILVYVVLSFLLSFTREIIKDIADIPGDSRYGCTTIAVKNGIVAASRLAALILFLVLSLLILIQALYLPGLSAFLLYYSVFLLDIPLVYLIYLTLTARDKIEFQRLGSSIKMLMFLGVFSMIFVTL